MTPFLILALPRSRTAWLSRFLSYGDWACGHEELRHCRSLDDIKAWFSQPFTGTIETAATPFWRLLDTLAPGVRIITIRRPVKEVISSLKNTGLGFDDRIGKVIHYLDSKLDQIEARVQGVKSVRFSELDDEASCAALFEHALGIAHNHEHWRRLAGQNIQIDLRAMCRYAEAYRPALEKLTATARHRSLSNLSVQTPIVADGVTLQVEDFDTWLRDAVGLFREHLVEVGESPDNWKGKNIPLMRNIWKAGALQIMTARCNGRMLGYLMTIIAPSLESAALVSAANTTFFVSTDAPGLGVKLQRAALAELKARGVGEVHMQAGVRGSGQRLGTIFRRLGAQEAGQVFRLSLEAA